MAPGPREREPGHPDFKLLGLMGFGRRRGHSSSALAANHNERLQL